jgi:glycosyltransferase involved in cell wall biosynthesis
VSDVTVAIPVRNGGPLFRRTLRALASQTISHELLVCDSQSSDGSADAARTFGARVLEIAPTSFSHGGTRNLLMKEASGSRVALLTQDSEPADGGWLERLLGGLELAPDVAIVFGPYLPRPSAPPALRAELEQWFSSLAPDGEARVERLSEAERGALPAAELVGRRGFFTDANACVLRSAWEQVPFREVAYAEDRLLALDMLRAGYAKAFVPGAATLHSHDYSTVQELRRCFDEWRGLREVYGWREPANPLRLARDLRGRLGQARRELERTGTPRVERPRALVAVATRQLARSGGALLGSRAGRLPRGLRRRLSLEGRDGFVSLSSSAPAAPGTDSARRGASSR